MEKRIVYGVHGREMVVAEFSDDVINQRKRLIFCPFYSVINRMINVYNVKNQKVLTGSKNQL